MFVEIGSSCQKRWSGETTWFVYQVEEIDEDRAVNSNRSACFVSSYMWKGLAAIMSNFSSTPPGETDKPLIPHKEPAGGLERYRRLSQSTTHHWSNFWKFLARASLLALLMMILRALAPIPPPVPRLAIVCSGPRCWPFPWWRWFNTSVRRLVWWLDEGWLVSSNALILSGFSIQWCLLFFSPIRSTPERILEPLPAPSICWSLCPFLCLSFL